MLDRDGHGAVALKGQAAREHLIEHDAGGVDVRARVGAVALRLLGRDVVDGAERLLRHGVGGVGKTGDAEVRDLDAAVAQHHDVLRLDVAVDDAARMRVAQPLHNLCDEMQRLAPVQTPAPLHILLECDAVDELHDDVLRRGARHVIDRNDVRVGEHRDGLGFVVEAAAEIRVAREIAFQYLDRHKAVEPVALGLIDHCHAAAADQLKQLIAVVQHSADHLIHLCALLSHS